MADGKPISASILNRLKFIFEHDGLKADTPADFGITEKSTQADVAKGLRMLRDIMFNFRTTTEKDVEARGVGLGVRERTGYAGFRYTDLGFEDFQTLRNSNAETSAESTGNEINNDPDNNESTSQDGNNPTEMSAVGNSNLQTGSASEDPNLSNDSNSANTGENQDPNNNVAENLSNQTLIISNRVQRLTTLLQLLMEIMDTLHNQMHQHHQPQVHQ